MRTVILFCLQAEQGAGLFNAVKACAAVHAEVQLQLERRVRQRAHRRRDPVHQCQQQRQGDDQLSGILQYGPVLHSRAAGPDRCGRCRSCSAGSGCAGRRGGTRRSPNPSDGKAVLPDGLELVEVGTHYIGFHCKLGGRSEKDDLDDVIVLPDLLGGGNAVFGRHDDI